MKEKLGSRIKLNKVIIGIAAVGVIAVTAIIISPIGTPIVSAVQNIFMGLNTVKDIKYGGKDVLKVLYRGQVVWERQLSLRDGMNMQDATQTLCDNTPLGTTVNLKDQRDNKYYRVRKMADNRCWMIDNLAYDINTAPATGKPAYNPTAQLVAGTTTSVNTRAQYVQNNNTAGQGQIPNNGNPTPSYLYNWCAAMGDTSANCTTTVAYQENQPATPQTGICPAPFRLPIGGAGATTQGNGTNQAIASNTTTNEFAKLDIWLGGTGTNRSNANTYSNFMSDNITNPQLFFSGVLSGGYNSGLNGLNNQGTSGWWWSSTAYTGMYGYYLSIFSGSTNVGLSLFNNKNVSVAVRCLL